MTLPKNIRNHYGKEIKVIEKFQTGNYGITYQVLVDNDDYVLKIIPDNENTSLDQILAFLKYLNQKNVRVPNPLETIDKQLFCKEVYNNKPVICFMYPLLSGNNLEDIIQPSIRSGLFKKLGIELAQLHKAMNSYPREHLDTIKKWDEVEGLMVIYEEIHHDIPSKIIEVYEQSRRDLKDLDLNENQMIHNDMHMANILFQENTRHFKFIDLDECILGSRMMDLAILCFDLPVICPDKSLCVSGISDIFSGYETLIPIDVNERKAIPVMLKILEAASYINYYKYKDAGDSWIQSFYLDRQEKLLSQAPFLKEYLW